MSEREMLLGLLENFWLNNDGLEWSWQEGTTVRHIDPKLNSALIEFYKKNGVKPL